MRPQASGVRLPASGVRRPAARVRLQASGKTAPRRFRHGLRPVGRRWLRGNHTKGEAWEKMARVEREADTGRRHAQAAGGSGSPQVGREIDAARRSR